MLRVYQTFPMALDWLKACCVSHVIRVRPCIWPLLFLQERYRGSNSVHGFDLRLSRRSLAYVSNTYHTIFNLRYISLARFDTKYTLCVLPEDIYAFPTFLLCHICYPVCVYNSHGTSLVIRWDVLLTYLSDDLMRFRFR